MFEPSCVPEPDSGHREADPRGVRAAAGVSAEGGGGSAGRPAAGGRGEERAGEEEVGQHHQRHPHLLSRRHRHRE